MGFLLSATKRELVLKPPFDIAGDLDTPVSAFAKLGAFNPRFLLESVEGGERLARYSFIGFGNCLEVRLDAAGLADRRRASPRPRTAPRIARRAAQGAGRARPSRCRRWPACRWPAAWSAIPPYDVVRYFERLPSRSARAERRCRTCTTSRPIHAGVRSPDARHRAAACRQRGRAPGAAPRGHPRAARRPAELGPARAGPLLAPPAAPVRCARNTWPGVKRTQEYIAAGDVYQLVLSSPLLRPPLARSLPGLPRAAPHQSFSLHVLLQARRCHRGRFLARGAGEGQAGARRSCGRSPARGRAPRIRPPIAQHEEELLADAKENAEHVMLVDLARNDLGRVAQRRQRARGSVPLDRALQPRHAHRQRREGRARPGQGCLRPVRRDVSRRHAGRRAEGARHGDHRRARAGAPRPVRRHGRATSARAATWTRPSPSARWCSAATNTATRPAPASSPTACRRPNTTKCSPRAAPWRARSSSRQEGL